MNLFTIDKKTCNKDGICAAECPRRIIVWKKGEYPVPAADADDLCISCGHCVAVCPKGSLSHRTCPLDECPPIQQDLRVTVGQCEQLLKSRRSVRAYKDKPVSRDDLAKAVDMARYAPSGHNSQCVEWLVITDKDRLHTLAGMVIDWMRLMAENKIENTYNIRAKKLVESWERGTDVILRDAPVLVVTHGDKKHPLAAGSSPIALTYFELAATGIGLGCCWNGYFSLALQAFTPLREALKLPEGNRAFDAMIAGYPKYTYHRIPTRKTPSIIWE